MAQHDTGSAGQAGHPLASPAGLSARYPGLARVIGRRWRYGAAALDQMALSIFGFGLNLCLVRALSATDFGALSLWMTIGLLAIGVQNALVNGPLSIHVPGAADPADARRLEAALAVVNLLAIGVIAALVVAANVSIDADWAPHGPVAVVAIAAFVAAGMYREYCRSVAFGRKDMAMLLWVDGPYLAVTSLCLGAMLLWPARLAGLAAAFFAMSAGCAVSRLCLRGRFSLPQPKPLRRAWVREYRAILGDVKWAMAGMLASHLSARSYVYLAANLAGLAALAALNVVGILFRPVRILLSAWGRAALPSLATELANGRVAAFDRALRQACVAAIAGNAAWFCALWFGWGPIERYFLAGHYPEAWSLMLPWAAASALNALAFVLGLALQAAREFRFLAWADLLAAPVTLAATAGAIKWHGCGWAMYGVALGSLATLAMYAARLGIVRQQARARSGLPRPEPIEAAATF